jgi:diadenosine tetraphosphate (Ap4A) HIT family hydrolase
MFTLDSKLNADTFLVADLKVSRLLLMNDSNYPWLILVPRKADLVELTDLNFEEQVEVLREINLVAKILQENFGAEKLNIGALGNVVKQLHIHVIARFKNDVAFPKPVWGTVAAKPYLKNEAEGIIKKIRFLIA